MLDVPHYPQEHDTSCVPASVRMVLAYWGIERDEISISRSLQSEEEGTNLLNIELFKGAELGVDVQAGELEPEQIRQFVDQGIPVIAGIWTAMLPNWQINRPHAVVIVGYEEQELYLNDPKFPDAPQTVSWKDFLAAWGELGCFAAVIRKVESRV